LPGGSGPRVGRTFAESRPWWPEPRGRAGAPNVVVVLCDDLGFADVSPYGSEIDTPAIERLAADGVRYVNFHVTPMCSPTRAALLTGVNPHAAGMGHLSSRDLGFPGYRSELAASVATAAEVFRANGYATFAVGKWHLTPGNELSEAADRSSWPLQRGFDRWYGFLESGFSNWHHPNLLYEDNGVVEVDRYPDGYYFTDDITDRAISMIRTLKTADPAKPFFLYLAHGAVHAPLMAKPDDIAKYRGRYDAGWDRIREERFARQLELGIVPPGTRLAPRNEEPIYAVDAWADLPPAVQELYARHMEVYAAMVDNVDQNLGRLLDALRALGQLENTIVVFTSDNGASREGGREGTTEYLRTIPLARSGTPFEAFERDRERLDLLGGPRLMGHYPQGWAMVSNTPFRLYKITTFAGGHQVPLIVSWPGGLAERGAIRRQYAFVTDVLPTLVDLIGLELPTERDGVLLRPPTGASLAATLRDAGAPTAHPEQYYEIRGHRGYYRDGWEIVTLHYPQARIEDDRWQLFHTAADPTQLDDLADAEPGRVEELERGWDELAWANDVYPLGDLAPGGLHAGRRPGDVDPDAPLVLRPANHTLEPHRAKTYVQGRSFTVTVQLDFRPGDEGMLVAHGDQAGGYALYVERDELVFAHNWYGRITLVGAGALERAAEVVLDVEATAERTWNVTVAVDGVERARRSGLGMFLLNAPFEGIDVGIDRRSPVSWDVYERHGPFPYTGALETVTYAPGPPVARAAPSPAAREQAVRRFD
jgi:arylsulfatase